MITKSQWQPIDAVHHDFRFSNDGFYVSCYMQENNMFQPETPFAVVRSIGKEVAIRNFVTHKEAELYFQETKEFVKKLILENM